MDDLYSPCDLAEAFAASKQYICEHIRVGVQIFDKDHPTCLATDWSKDGIGFWLFQKHCQCPFRELFCCQEGWRVTLVGSCFTHTAESRYAPVEGEALAVADALDKTCHFVLGCSPSHATHSGPGHHQDSTSPMTSNPPTQPAQKAWTQHSPPMRTTASRLQSALPSPPSPPAGNNCKSQPQPCRT